MNRDFIDIFGYMETEEQMAIMGRYTARGYLEAKETIDAKAADMVEHYVSSVFPNGFKAQVVGVSKEAAARYKDALEKHLAKKITELKDSNPLNIDIDRLEALKVACVISTAPNDEPHLKIYGNEDQNELIIDGFKAPFGSTGKKGGDGNYGIIVVTSMLLTGFDAPVEQVMYLDKILKNHGLLQAIARVNRTSGKDKTCGYVVDYVGVANHLREALAEYDAADIDETMETLRNVDQDIDALNSAYNSIMQFIRDRVGAPSLENAEMIIEELVADDELSEEFNVLFGNISRMFDRVLPNPAALDYSEDFKRLSFIRESVAKRRRDPLLSMRDASKKVRAIIEDYLEINGIEVEVEPVSLLSDDFLAGTETLGRSDRAVSNEIEYAVREYINVNMPRDPEYFARLAEKLDEILQQFRDNWAEMRAALTRLRDDVAEGRRRENTYGYEPEHEMPFFALMKKELFGDRDFSDLGEDNFNALKDLTNDVLERLKRDTTTVNFWNNTSLQNELRTFIINQLIAPEVRRRVPEVFAKRKEIAQRILELGYQHYRRNGE
jgi:type I restriction enzyme R subunit